MYRGESEERGAGTEMYRRWAIKRERTNRRRRIWRGVRRMVNDIVAGLGAIVAAVGLIWLIVLMSGWRP